MIPIPKLFVILSISVRPEIDITMASIEQQGFWFPAYIHISMKRRKNFDWTIYVSFKAPNTFHENHEYEQCPLSY